jgi:hypothetical protein
MLNLIKLVRNARGRDSQRRKLYRAENAAIAKMARPSFRDAIEYQQSLNGIMRSEWMRNNFPAAGNHVALETNRGMRSANANERRIKTGLTPYLLHPMIMCHELAHVIVRRVYGRRMWVDEETGTLHSSPTGLRNYSLHFIAGHGPEYADVYLRLVREFVGYEPWKLLRAEFDAAGIRYCAPSEYAARPVRQPRFAMAGACAARAPINGASRNSNPAVKSSVRVTGGHLQRPTIYPSVRVAFAMLQLPMNQHQKFRKQLKLDGTNTIGAFTFNTISKE